MLQCKDFLSFKITQALACAQPLPGGSEKASLITFGLIHLFVVSGFHVHTLYKILKKRCDFKTTVCLCILGFYTLSCNLPVPLARAFLQLVLHELSKKQRLTLPPPYSIGLSGLICLPLSLYKDQLLSLGLSTFYSCLLFNLRKNKSYKNFGVYFFSLPIFLSTFGLPHFLQVFFLPLASFLVAFILTPLSLLSLFLRKLEFLVLHLWWVLNESLDYFQVFFNLHENTFIFTPPQVSFFSVYLFIYFIWTCLGEINWKRQSFFF